MKTVGLKEDAKYVRPEEHKVIIIDDRNIDPKKEETPEIKIKTRKSRKQS